MEGGQDNEEKPSPEEWPLEKAEVCTKKIPVTFFSESWWDLFPRWLQRKVVCNNYDLRFCIFAALHLFMN